MVPIARRSAGTDEQVGPGKLRHIHEYISQARCARIRATAALCRDAWEVAAQFEEQAAVFEHAAGLLADGDEDDLSGPQHRPWNDDAADGEKPGTPGSHSTGHRPGGCAGL